MHATPVNYASLRSGSVRDVKDLELARKELRRAALAYADIAREIDECFAEESQP